MNLEEAKEILKKELMCEKENCTGMSCSKCNYFVFPDDLNKALQTVLDALGNADDCTGCKYYQPGLIVLPCETCRRTASDNYEAEDEETE